MVIPSLKPGLPTQSQTRSLFQIDKMFAISLVNAMAAFHPPHPSLKKLSVKANLNCLFCQF